MALFIELDTALHLQLLILPCILIFVVIATRSHHGVLQTFGLTRRPASSAAFTSDAKTGNPKGKADNISDHFHDFPPDRREALDNLRKSMPSAFSGLGDVRLNDASSVTSSDCVPLGIPSNEVPGHMRTPTGLSMAEVRALGDFPDYAKLSGVPLPAPHETFNPRTTTPRPYRPLKWPYHQTMGLTKMQSDWWLELDSTYEDRMAQRKALLEEHGATILDYADGTELACKEAMEIALTFLVTRYPRHFSLSADKTMFYNRILVIETQLSPPVKHPLHVLYEHVPEDFVLMQRCHKTGHYVLRAGFIVSSVGWTLGEKFNKPLYEIHEPVPHYAEKMSSSMNRFFARMPTDRPIQRASWDVCPGQMLFAVPDDPVVALRAKGQADPPQPIDNLHLRVDWQTLRRLPLSGAICFNFKARFTPITRFREEAYIPALFGRVMKDGDSKIMDYKMHGYVENIGMHDGTNQRLSDVMEGWAKEQEDKGLTERDWDVGTLHEFPFFPGWNA